MHTLDTSGKSSTALALSHIRHYLPTQNPLRDFIHHNTLHAFQHQNFHEALHFAARNFGYQVYLTLSEYRDLYQNNKINKRILLRCIEERKGQLQTEAWLERLTNKPYDETFHQRIGKLRKFWKSHYQINLDKQVHPALFRIVGAFLDQGIANQKFLYHQLPFLQAVKNLEENSFTSFFYTNKSKRLLLSETDPLPKLLELIVGDDTLIEHYLFDQQFAHPGWSGMVCVLEENQNSLLDSRTVSLRDFVTLELLLELDALHQRHGDNWHPITTCLPPEFDKNTLAEFPYNELFDVYSLWQEAFEWSYYDKVLMGMKITATKPKPPKYSFQAVLCLDDRECSFRRYLEKNDPFCATFSTAGFFNVPFYFQPENGKFSTKSCPAPQFPSHLIREQQSKRHHLKEALVNKHTHSFWGGLIISPTMGFWSAIKLGINVLFPSETPVMVSSFKHMDKNSCLTIESSGKKYHHLQIGFSVAEMAERIIGLLRGIGLLENFAPLVYLIGHGASSVNNTHYAGYDCGACSGRAGSANARVAALMANNLEVRQLLQKSGIFIPETTQFVGALHDTTRDEIEFFDTDTLSEANQKNHRENMQTFERSLHENAKERSRRFLLMNSAEKAEKIHEKVKLRALSLFEPRPEWNHATNAICIIGNRENNKHLFLDRRSFLNSYDYRIDTDGSILLGILNAIAPVCGGINLEYYFSRVDNYRLGAGTKLPHNVMGLIGVANGMDGDLRAGLPKQMINIHDPLRLLVIIEHFPADVLQIVQRNPATYEWFAHSWIHLAVVHPENKDIFIFRYGSFVRYQPISEPTPQADFLEKVFEYEAENLPVFQV